MLPNFPDDTVIFSWEIIGEGGHGQVRKAEVGREGQMATAAIKLFNGKFRDAYERERDAYTLLTHRRVRRCIPEVYHHAEWPRWKWDGLQPDNYEDVDRDELLYGIVMEYFPDCQQIDMKRADLRLADLLALTFQMIMDAGVIHNDIDERNIMIVRESGKARVVWIDFSSAWSGVEFLSTYGRSMQWDMFRAFLLEEMVRPILVSTHLPLGPQCNDDRHLGRTIS